MMDLVDRLFMAVTLAGMIGAAISIALLVLI
jgi:hypothetical protein